MALNQEQRLSFNVPSKWANRFTVYAQPHGVRLAFAEAAPDEDKAYDFHSAVVMSLDDAEILHKLLGAILEKARR